MAKSLAQLLNITKGRLGLAQAIVRLTLQPDEV